MPVDSLVRLVNKAISVVSAFSKPPPATWDPTVIPMRSWIKKFGEISRVEGIGRAYNKLRIETQLRSGGQYIGTDYNGNKYFENKNAPYGRTRWVEYPTVPGVWALEDKVDGSMVSPDWHGWLHYMHDTPGNKVVADFGKPFKQPHRVNQTMLRPCYTTPPGITSKDHSEGEPAAFHKPPGAWGENIKRGRLGAKYQAWDPSGSSGPSELRNYADNAKTLHIS
mmetsp:Transcript_70144/g.116516  ORF Transcript_70144/g.116516 Transcript_70144/m.116516 type:complete len:223 (-) Transcript_70144:152-820(-)